MAQEEQRNLKRRKKLTFFWRSILEVWFIIFLFYSNLLMGEFEHSGAGEKKGLLWAINDIFTIQNFTIAIIFALIGYLVLEYFRKRL
jgi:hypothetical protein